MCDKNLPRQMMMQTREVVTVPSERVAVDIVGPFPVAKGGFRYLLTYLDMATRWPEASISESMVVGTCTPDMDAITSFLFSFFNDLMGI